MIGKTIVGRSFKGCINYNLTKVENGKGEILEVRGVREGRQAMIRDFNMRRSANLLLTKNVWHTSLSFPENLSNEKMLAITKSWIQGMGLSNSQYVIVRHYDTPHPHVHIVASRIGDDAKTISDSNNWFRSEALCRELERAYQLTPVPTQRDESKIDRSKLKGRDLLKTDVNRALKEILTTCQSFDELQSSMGKRGIQCLIKSNPDGTIRGVSFERNGVKIKASDINRLCSARNLAKDIEMVRAKKRVKSDQMPSKAAPALGKGLLFGMKKIFNHPSQDTEDEESRKKKKDQGYTY